MTYADARRPRVLHIITGLEQGGAERQLTLLCNQDPETSTIFSLREPGPMVEELQHTGVPVASGKAGRMLSTSWIPRLLHSFRKCDPDVVVGWMYHGMIAATLTRTFGFRGPLLWNVRHSVADLNDERPATRLIIRLGARLSRLPQRIIYNSQVAAAQHEALGFHARRAVIPNGFDTERFRPNAERRSQMRHAMGLSDHDWLVGVIGRAHPMKNHTSWLDALTKIRSEGWPVRSLMVGTGLSDDTVADQVYARGLNDAVTLCEGTATPEDVYPGLDLLVLPSRWGEAFPNVVGESMACGVPAIVTDVGDAAHVVGRTGFVSKSADSNDLANTTIAALHEGPDSLRKRGQLARDRIRNTFSVKATMHQYNRLLG